MTTDNLDRFTLSRIADTLSHEVARRQEVQASDVRDGCMSTMSWENAQDELEELRITLQTVEAHIANNF